MRTIPFLLFSVLSLSLILPFAHATTQIGLSIDGPSIVFPGEQAEWLIAVSSNGTLTSVSPAPTVAFYNVTQGTTISISSPTNPTTGIYIVTYSVPSNIAAGYYALVVSLAITPSPTVFLPAAVVHGFQVSRNLNSWNAVIVGSDPNGLTAIQTNVGYIKLNLTTVNGKITEVKNGVATVETDIGTLQGGVNFIRTNMTSVNSNLGILGSMSANLNALLTWWNLDKPSGTGNGLYDIAVRGNTDANAGGSNLFSIIAMVLSLLTFILVLVSIFIRAGSRRIVSSGGTRQQAQWALPIKPEPSIANPSTPMATVGKPTAPSSKSRKVKAELSTGAPTKNSQAQPRSKRLKNSLEHYSNSTRNIFLNANKSLMRYALPLAPNTQGL